MEILPRDYFLEIPLRDFPTSLLVPMVRSQPHLIARVSGSLLDFCEKKLGCCLGFLLVLVETDSNPVELVGSQFQRAKVLECLSIYIQIAKVSRK